MSADSGRRAAALIGQAWSSAHICTHRRAFGAIIARLLEASQRSHVKLGLALSATLVQRKDGITWACFKTPDLVEFFLARSAKSPPGSRPQHSHDWKAITHVFSSADTQLLFKDNASAQVRWRVAICGGAVALCKRHTQINARRKCCSQ